MFISFLFFPETESINIIQYTELLLKTNYQIQKVIQTLTISMVLRLIIELITFDGVHIRIIAIIVPAVVLIKKNPRRERSSQTVSRLRFPFSAEQYTENAKTHSTDENIPKLSDVSCESQR